MDPDEEMKNDENNSEWVKNFALDKKIDSQAPEHTGKFGTGFLTTHLLSRVIDI
jgi:hypothetical protein